MSPKVIQIIEEAKQLNALERAELLEEVYKMFEDEVDKNIQEKWVEESEERINAYERGELKAIPYEDVKKSIWNSL